MTWQLPDTYHPAGHGRGTATLKFYEGRDILPARARWCQEWLGELSVLPTRRARVSFTAQTLRGMARLAVILHRPADNTREYRQ